MPAAMYSKHKSSYTNGESASVKHQHHVPEDVELQSELDDLLWSNGCTTSPKKAEAKRLKELAKDNAMKQIRAATAARNAESAIKDSQKTDLAAAKADDLRKRQPAVADVSPYYESSTKHSKPAMSHIERHSKHFPSRNPLGLVKNVASSKVQKYTASDMRKVGITSKPASRKRKVPQSIADVENDDPPAKKQTAEASFMSFYSSVHYQHNLNDVSEAYRHKPCYSSS